MPYEHIALSGAVEGIIDEVLLRKLCGFVGVSIGSVYGRKGKSHILQHMAGYNHSARFRHWIVLLDLDNDALCVPDILRTWLPAPSPLMRLRIAVREVESWLLGDRENFARYLSVPAAAVPIDPESLPDPKQEVVNLGRRSRRRAIREDIVPMQGSGQRVGPAYTSRMVEFIEGREIGWRPEIAAQSCDSLRRCIRALSELVRDTE